MKESLLEYLLNEITVDLDPNDPNTLNNVRQQMRLAARNPSKVAKDQIRNAKQELQSAQRSDNNQTKALDIKIARIKQQLAALQTQKQNILKRTKNESIEYPQDLCEVVYTDEDNNIIHTGSILSESAIQAYKRTGNVIKRQYRCTSGRKEGKIVSNPGDCTKKKNPKLIRAGKRSAKKNKAIRVQKTKISKNKAISKMVTSLNKKLSGN